MTVQTFAYNASGDSVRSESYVEGEEQTSGREVEEHEYDENGYEVRTCTYNTLDPSSCLCTEVKLDENGRATAEADATGKWETTFSYTPDGAVRSKRLPNGSRLAYGFDRDGSVTAITHSTEEGEENSVTRLYPAVVLSVGSPCCRHFQAGTGVGACRRVCQALFFIFSKSAICTNRGDKIRHILCPFGY